MGSLRDPLSCRPAPVRSQYLRSAVGSLDFEAGSHTLQVWVLHRTSARLALPEHAAAPVALAQIHLEPETEWQSVP